MRLLNNKRECCKVSRYDRTKDQMIGRLNVRQYDMMSAARPNMRFYRTNECTSKMGHAGKMCPIPTLFKKIFECKRK